MSDQFITFEEITAIMNGFYIHFGQLYDELNPPGTLEKRNLVADFSFFDRHMRYAFRTALTREDGILREVCPSGGKPHDLKVFTDAAFSIVNHEQRTRYLNVFIPNHQIDFKQIVEGFIG